MKKPRRQRRGEGGGAKMERAARRVAASRQRSPCPCEARHSSEGRVHDGADWRARLRDATPGAGRRGRSDQAEGARPDAEALRRLLLTTHRQTDGHTRAGTQNVHACIHILARM